MYSERKGVVLLLFAWFLYTVALKEKEILTCNCSRKILSSWPNVDVLCFRKQGNSPKDRSLLYKGYGGCCTPPHAKKFRSQMSPPPDSEHGHLATPASHFWFPKKSKATLSTLSTCSTFFAPMRTATAGLENVKRI